MDSPKQRVIENASPIISERLRQLYDYWADVKGKRFAPARKEINPVKLRDHLGWIWLMDVIDDGEDFRFRLGGDRIVQFLGERLAGLRLKEVQPKSPVFFGRFFDLAALATKKKKPVLGGPTQTAYEPKAYLEVEAVLLPLSDDGVNVTGLLGSIEIKPLQKN